MVSLRIFGVAIALACFSGCDQANMPTSMSEAADKPQTVAATTNPRSGNLNCEAKDNSGGPCDPLPDPAPERVSQAAEPAATSSRPQYDPSDCSNETGAHMMMPVFAAMATGTLDDWQNYCNSIGMGPDATGPMQSLPANSNEGGGCVWKGKTYSAGDRIHYSQGTIYAGDLYVNGTRFDILSDVGRGPGERFQACECGSTSQVWGCI